MEEGIIDQCYKNSNNGGSEMKPKPRISRTILADITGVAVSFVFNYESLRNVD